MLTAEIIAIGSELLTPRFKDTNSVFLTEQLNRMGIPVALRTIVGDHEDDLEHALKSAMDRTPIVITIGGLGPTEDDITRKALAQATRLQLVLDDAVLEQLKARFDQRSMEMPANSARQALVPAGAEVLENPNGSAPGLWLSKEKNTFILLPGPPRELEPMFERSCSPRLTRMAGPLAIVPPYLQNDRASGVYARRPHRANLHEVPESGNDAAFETRAGRYPSGRTCQDRRRSRSIG